MVRVAPLSRLSPSTAPHDDTVDRAIDREMLRTSFRGEVVRVKCP